MDWFERVWAEIFFSLEPTLTHVHENNQFSNDII